MIIGRDMLSELGIDLRFSDNVVKWNGQEIDFRPDYDDIYDQNHRVPWERITQVRVEFKFWRLPLGSVHTKFSNFIGSYFNTNLTLGRTPIITILVFVFAESNSTIHNFESAGLDAGSSADPYGDEIGFQEYLQNHATDVAPSALEDCVRKYLQVNTSDAAAPGSRGPTVNGNGEKLICMPMFLEN